MKPAKWRNQTSKIKWDGLPSSFRKFKKEVEGYLIQVGAGYIVKEQFLDAYSKLGIGYLKTDVFWKSHEISHPQAYADCKFLYGLLMTATSHMQNKIIIKYHDSQDGIMAWIEFKREYGYEGSKDLRIEYLEALVRNPIPITILEVLEHTLTNSKPILVNLRPLFLRITMRIRKRDCCY